MQPSVPDRRLYAWLGQSGAEGYDAGPRVVLLEDEPREFDRVTVAGIGRTFLSTGDCACASKSVGLPRMSVMADHSDENVRTSRRCYCEDDAIECSASGESLIPSPRFDLLSLF